MSKFVAGRSDLMNVPCSRTVRARWGRTEEDVVGVTNPRRVNASSRVDKATPASHDTTGSQPLAATVFVSVIIAASMGMLALWGPDTYRPGSVRPLLAASALASSLRLRVPLGTSSSNLSVSYAWTSLPCCSSART